MYSDRPSAPVLRGRGGAMYQESAAAFDAGFASAQPDVAVQMMMLASSATALLLIGCCHALRRSSQAVGCEFVAVATPSIMLLN